MVLIVYFLFQFFISLLSNFLLLSDGNLTLGYLYLSVLSTCTSRKLKLLLDLWVHLWFIICRVTLLQSCIILLGHRPLSIYLIFLRRLYFLKSCCCILLWLVRCHRGILVSLTLCCWYSWKASGSSNCSICGCNLLLGAVTQSRSCCKMVVLLQSISSFLRYNRCWLLQIWLLWYFIRSYAIIWVCRQLESGGSLSNNSIAKIILVRTIYLSRI